MPPRKSARNVAKSASHAPTAHPLGGVRIALSGTLPLKQAEVISKVTALGGEVSVARTGAVKSVDYLIASQADFDKNSAKVTDAKAQNLPILHLDWLLECASKNARVPEKQFLLKYSSVDSATCSAASKTNGKKRGASASALVSDAEDEERQEPQPKKTKTANGQVGSKKSATPAPVPAHDASKKTLAAKGKGKSKGKDKAKAEPESSDTDMRDADTVDELKKEKKENRELASGQTAKSKDLKIPIDEHFKLPMYSVYIDPSNGMIWDCSLNQTNAGSNNNKFYRIQILHYNARFLTWTRWGRVGERGQFAALGNGTLPDAVRHFEKKFKDKSGLTWANRLDPPRSGRYVFLEKSYEDDSDKEDEDVETKKGDEEEYKEPQSTLPSATQDLMGLIFNTQYWTANLASLNYDTNKLPLGKLSKTTITRGFQALKDLSDRLDKPSGPGTSIIDLSNLYYSLIPHDFGRNRPPVITTQALLKKEIDLLESLSDMKDAQNILNKERKSKVEMNLLDSQYEGLGMQEMSPLDHGSEEFRQLADYLMKTTGSTHNVKYKVEDIFRIERQGEKARFEESKYFNIPSDRRLLWHGSRVTNFGGILSQGLRIAPPEAPVTGYMFGKGIYLADMSSKSAGYCCSYISGNTGLLLLCETELGDPMQKLTNAAYDAGETAQKGGMHSTWGQGRTAPLKWKDAGCVHPSLKGVKMPDTTIGPGDTHLENACLYYNEYIVYDIAQIRLRYLLRVKM